MIEVLNSNLPFLVGFLCVLGLLIGSFLNVVIHRFPKMLHKEWRATASEILKDAKYTIEAPVELANESQEKYNLVVPRSACPKCHHKITALENIPLISWLVLKGKCSSCKNPISARYPFIELLTGVAFALAAYSFGFGWPLLMATVLIVYLVAGSWIDYDHKILPDQLTLPLVWFGILFTYVLTEHLKITMPANLAQDLVSSVLGAIVGYMVLWSVYWLFKIVTGKEGMGHGDFKLLAAIGAFLGVQQLPLVIILSTVTGAVLGILGMILSKKGRDHQIPFGPFLAIAAWIAMMWGTDINDAYLGML